MNLLFLVVLWIHAVTATFFIGGSLFIWMVVWPASYRFTSDEKERTRMLGAVGRVFGTLTDISIVILYVTGAYLGLAYLSGLSNLGTEGGRLLVAKTAIVLIMTVLLYANNLYHGKKIVRLASEGKMDQVRKIRRVTHIASYITLGLLTTIAVIAFTLPFYHP